MYKRSLLNALKMCVSDFEDDLDLLAKLTLCLRLPMSKTGTFSRFIERYWLGGACGEAGATHLTVATAELRNEQKTGRLQMSPAISCETSGRTGGQHAQKRKVL